MKKRQAALLDLHYDILKEILIRVAGSSNGAKDFAKAISVCKAFRQFVEDEDVLRAVAFDDLSIDGCRSRRLFQLMGGLVCRCAQAGQGQAQYILAKLFCRSPKITLGVRLPTCGVILWDLHYCSLEPLHCCIRVSAFDMERLRWNDIL